MDTFTQRLGNWFPVVVAAAIPVVYLPNRFDAFILPRAALVIAGACLGTGLALLVPNRRPLGALRWPLVAAFLALLLAFAFSISWPLSAIGSYSRYESLPVRLGYLGLMATAVWLLRTPRSRGFLVTAVILGATECSVIAITQIDAGFRPDGNLGNANLLGALIAVAVPLCVSQMFRPGWAAIGAWLCLPVMVWGLVLSTSRSGAIGALAGCLALVVCMLRGRAAPIAAVVSAFVVVGAVGLILVTPLNLLNGDPAAQARLKLYPDAVTMIASRPLTGWGEDATGLVLNRFLRGNYMNGVTVDRVHSGPLDVAATQGLVGLAATGWLLLVVGRGLWANRFATSEARVRGRLIASVPVGTVASALVAYTVWVLVNFDWAPVTGIFWLLAGTGWSMAHPGEPANAVEPVPWSPLATAQRLAGALALVVGAIAFAVLPVLAENWYSDGRYDLAVRADPLQAQYRRALGEVLTQQGSPADGLEQLRLAASLGDTDPSLYVELGDAELAAGNIDDARADYRRALEIDPYWAPAQRRLSGNGGLGVA